MRTLERGRRRESLEKNIAQIALAYGFSAPPIVLSRKAAAAVPNVDPKTSVALGVLRSALKSVGTGVGAVRPLQLWGGARTSKGTVISFAALSKSAIANAIVVKTALSVGEAAGMPGISAAVSSVGDNESKRRFTRELGNFFKKNADAVPSDLKARSSSDPDAAYRELLARHDPLSERAPKVIDFLSENSRKIMLDTLSLFESVGIAYSIDPRLHGEPGVHSELLFAIDSEKDGVKTRIALGGKVDEAARKSIGATGDVAVVSLSLPKDIDFDDSEAAPACFVVHVGEAAKLKAFILLEALWKAHIAVTQTLLSDNFKEQIDTGRLSGAKYLGIIGQREALDNTIIIRNTGTQLQVTLPLDKLEGYVSRAAR